jgi:S1-C subfamily serine protease
VQNPDDVAAAIGERRPQERVTVEYLRDGDRRAVDVVLGVRPAP